MQLRAILSTHPKAHGDADEVGVRATEACFDCTQACVACADACLAEESVDKLRECIRLNLDCADVCYTAAVLGLRQPSSDKSISGALFALCAEMCRRCGDECMQHAEHHEHCRICAEVCRSCEQACRNATRSPELH